jgi:hypothetical protein
LLYTAPAGTTTAPCTQADPCALSQAFALAAPGRDTIFMGSGTYTETVSVGAGTDATVVGNGATLAAPIAFVSSSKLNIAGLTLGGGISCIAESTADSSSISLVDVTIGQVTEAVASKFCNLSMLQVTQLGYRSSSLLPNWQLTSGKLTVDRSVVAELIVEDTGPPASQGTALAITNSRLWSLAQIKGANVQIDIEFSTFVDGATCETTTLPNITEHLWNDLFYELPTFTGGTTCFDYDMVNGGGSGMPVAGLSTEKLLFVDPSNDDFHLMLGSPAIDAADPAATDAIDFDGTARPQGVGRDIGAYEYH